MWQITGNQKAITLLIKNLQQGNVPHAYLFIGPAHVGKLTLAKAFARMLNCQAETVPCGNCSSCIRIERGKFSDLQIFEPFTEETPGGKQRSVISIETIKDVQKSVFLSPYEGKYKIYIFKDAERLTPEAANRLLKVLEEPPPYVVFILLTGREQLVLPTIVSRCQKIYLTPSPVHKIEDMLMQKGIAEQRAKLIARLSGGCPGWAVSAIEDDHLISERETYIKEFIFLIHSSLDQTLKYAEHLSKGFKDNQKDLYLRLSLWLSLFRDLLFIKCECVDLITNINFADELEKLSEEFSLNDVVDILQHIMKAKHQLQININVRLVLELLLLKAARFSTGASVV